MVDQNKTSNLIMTRQESRSFDFWAINEIKIPGAVLMENAGRGSSEIFMRIYPDTALEVAILCGAGNNGGDGFVIARHLLNSGYSPKVILLGDPDKVSGDAKINLDILLNMNIKLYNFPIDSPALLAKLEKANVIIDAVFGTGLQGQLRAGYAEFLESVNRLEKDVFAVDIPSGLDCDTGLPLGAAIKAKDTTTFIANKSGFLKESAKQYTGNIHVVSIGISPGFHTDK